MPNRFQWILLALGLLLAGWLFGLPAVAAAPAAQAPTSTPPDLRVEIYQDANVRSGPGTEFDLVGVLIPGQTSAILGRSPDGTWIKIVYIGGPDNIGWVFANNVRVIGDLPSIPTVEPPPTPTRRPTTTPEVLSTGGPPTSESEAGRLPTFTAPAPEIRPTLLPVQGAQATRAFPPAFLIIILFVLGSFGGVLSLLRLRR